MYLGTFYATSFPLILMPWVLAYRFNLLKTFGNPDFIIQLLGSPNMIVLENTTSTFSLSLSK